MKAGSFPDRLISNTYIYDVRSYCYNTVLYSTLISLTVFLAIFFTNRNFIFIKNMYGSVIYQAANNIDAGLHFFGIPDIGLSL